MIKFILYMGNSSLNCFRTKDKPSLHKKMPTGTEENLSVINIKIWKELLGLKNEKQLRQFTIPNHVQHKTFKQIQKDITRTYPQFSFLSDTQNMQIFGNVLRKLSVYFPKTGYTQGMNFLAGFFLLSGLNEQDSFAMSVKVLTNCDIMGLGLYEDMFPLNRLYCSLVWEYLNRENPRIKKKISNFNIIDQLWIFQWFMTFFIYSFPYEIISEIWTYIFLKKELVCVRLAIAIVLLIWPFIQKCQNQIDFINLTQELKKYQSFQSKLNIQQILYRANQITNDEIKNLIPLVENQSHGIYGKYFQLSQNDRKSRYMQIHSNLVSERQEFMKDPERFSFLRKQGQLSMLDLIELSQTKLLCQSLTLRRPQQLSSPQLNQGKLYSSDLHKLKTATQSNEYMIKKEERTSLDEFEINLSSQNFSTKRQSRFNTTETK